VLAAITATLFGVGSYTLHHWKLEATSRGLLVIALLLVPLNFLVLAGLSPRFSGAPAELAIKVGGIAVFAFLTFRGARNLYGPDGRLLTLAVLGASIAPLPVARLIDGSAPPGAALMGLAAWPVLCHGLGVGLMLRRKWDEEAVDPRAGLRTLGFVALAT